MFFSLIYLVIQSITAWSLKGFTVYFSMYFVPFSNWNFQIILSFKTNVNTFFEFFFIFFAKEKISNFYVAIIIRFFLKILLIFKLIYFYFHQFQTKTYCSTIYVYKSISFLNFFKVCLFYFVVFLFLTWHIIILT